MRNFVIFTADYILLGCCSDSDCYGLGIQHSCGYQDFGGETS
jgi:hypothetical protein